MPNILIKEKSEIGALKKYLIRILKWKAKFSPVILLAVNSIPKHLYRNLVTNLEIIGKNGVFQVRCLPYIIQELKR